MIADSVSRNSRFIFISGRVSLDFAHTGGENERKQFEQLHTPADVTRWFKESALHLPGVAVTDLASFFGLREAIWHLAQATRSGAALPTSHLEVLNRMAAFAPPVPRLTLFGKQTVELPVTDQAALSVIARDAIDVLGSQTPILECANPMCHLLFVDTSFAQKRRWCAMERCGTRNKVSRFRSNNNKRRVHV